LPKPTIVLVIPLTVPVNVGLLNIVVLDSFVTLLSPTSVAVYVGLVVAFAQAYTSVAGAPPAVAAYNTFLFASAVLSTLPKPTIVLVIPLTVPINVGLARGAYTVKSGLPMILLYVIDIFPALIVLLLDKVRTRFPAVIAALEILVPCGPCGPCLPASITTGGGVFSVVVTTVVSRLTVTIEAVLTL
jgi:hypothetical protein